MILRVNKVVDRLFSQIFTNSTQPIQISNQPVTLQQPFGRLVGLPKVCTTDDRAKLVRGEQKDGQNIIFCINLLVGRTKTLSHERNKCVHVSTSTKTISQLPDLSLGVNGPELLVRGRMNLPMIQLSEHQALI